MTQNPPDLLQPTLIRIADALERMAPKMAEQVNFDAADAFVWSARSGTLKPVHKVNRVDLELLQGIEQVRDILLQNTMQFATGFPANNALLWGARGMGKSSVVKAIHAHVNDHVDCETHKLKFVEIHREDIESLPDLMALMAEQPFRFLLFCDDLSFDNDDTSYKALKAALDGGIEGRPENLLLYATSNRRHLMPRDMIENERSTAINPSEAVEEKVSLSDRFGLWLGFHKCSQDDYLKMVRGYLEHFTIEVSEAEWRPAALEWATTRGYRSGRTAWQFIQDLAGKKKVALKL
uniref:ATP-binding protein n=1 Tax=Pararhizobium sp. IMCC3301 TaxID=3067904 RepID=UPI002741BE84|nr:ATP-binding protein [Pararhizobium sp. IMCC3301]